MNYLANVIYLEGDIPVYYKTNKLKVITPSAPTPTGDGREYMKSTPLSSVARMGSEDGPTMTVLNDTCSNTSLMDRQTFKKFYPHAIINTSVRIDISGIGSAKSIGYSTVPIFMCGNDEEGQPALIKMECEFHLLDHFKPLILIGIDVLKRYSVDISITTNKAILPNDVTYPTGNRANVSREVTMYAIGPLTIPPRTCQAIPFSAEMVDGVDYMLQPHYVVQQGQPLWSPPNIPYGVLDNSVKHITFQNPLSEPCRITHKQKLGTLTPMKEGAFLVRTDQSVDWANLVRSGNRELVMTKPGRTPPESISEDFYTRNASDDMSHIYIFAFLVNTMQDKMATSYAGHLTQLAKQPLRSSGQFPVPRSISDAELMAKAQGAPKRIMGELPPAETDDETPPEAPIPGNSPPSGNTQEPLSREGIQTGPTLSSSQREQIIELVMKHDKAFSDGSRIGRVKGFKANIDTGQNKLPAPAHVRQMGPGKRASLDQTIEKLLEWDIIEPSTSPTAAPVVLVWQNNKWRFCVDYRALNAVTAGDAYPMLRSDHIFSTLASKRFFSLLDALKGYHQVEIEDQDKHKTAFISHRGLYQFKTLPMGLKNAPAQFQRMMDEILGGLRWEAALVYIDDLLVYSPDFETHLKHLEQVLIAAERAGLVFSLDKCKFGFDDLKVLGHGLSRYGLHTVAEKVRSITDLDRPKTMGELHRLLGMFGYYRAFIAQFAKIAKPLNDLKRSSDEGSKKNYNSKTPIPWNQECETAFAELKSRLSTAPILAHPRYDKPFILYTDASADALAAVLTQVWDDEEVDERWKVQGPSRDFVEMSDEAGWGMERGKEGKKIQKGKEKPQMLTYGMCAPQDGDRLTALEAFVAVSERTFDWDSLYRTDKTFREAYKKAIEADVDTAADGFRIREDGSMTYDTTDGPKTCLPEALVRETIHLAHDLLGHQGLEKTYIRICSSYYKPHLMPTVKSYIDNCPKCIVNKRSKLKATGEMLPIQAEGAFEIIAMDLIVGLPPSEGYDAIFVVIDKFSRAAILTPTTSNYTAESLAKLMFSQVIRRGWIPSKIISDRDGKFMSAFWQELMRCIGVRHRASTAYHPQTDGATERLNQTIESMLRMYTSAQQDNWVASLHLAELAYNTARSSATGYTPFQLIYTAPQDILQRILTPKPASNKDAAQFLEEARCRIEDARQAMKRASEQQKKYYDGTHAPLRKFIPGEYVCIRLDKQPSAQFPANKLAQQKLPPFKITKIVSGGRALELDIPKQFNMHNVVSVQNDDPAPNPHSDPFQRTWPKPLKIGPQTIMNSEILDWKKTRGGKTRYKVNWNGWPPENAVWRDEKDVDKVLIEVFKIREKNRKEQNHARTFDVSQHVDQTKHVSRQDGDEGQSVKEGDSQKGGAEELALGSKEQERTQGEKESCVADEHVRDTDGKMNGMETDNSDNDDDPAKCHTTTPLDSVTQVKPPPRKDKKIERPILYISRTTKPFEINYESTERELACVVWAFNKLRHLLEGSKTKIVTDHASIKDVLNTAVTTQYSLRIDKFRMLMAPYLDDIEVVYRPGKDHLNVDPLSRARWIGKEIDRGDTAELSGGDV